MNTIRFNLLKYNSIEFHSISCHDPGSVCHLVLAMRSKVSLELWASLNAFSVTTEKGERCSAVQRSAVHNRVKIRLAVMFDILKRLQRVSATLDAVCVSVSVCVCRESSWSQHPSNRIIL